MTLSRSLIFCFAKIIMMATFFTGFTACSEKNTTIMQDNGNGGSGDGVSSGGGGGDVVVCYNARNEIIDMESYDLWAGSLHSALTFDRKPVGENDNSGDDPSSYMSKAMATLGKVAKFDPVLFSKLNTIAQEFVPEQIAETDEVNPLKAIHKVPALTLEGSGAVVIPAPTSNCHRLVQERMFWQVDKPLPHQYKYQLVERLWNKAPSHVRAALVMHESVLRFERELYNPDTSVRAQYFNAVVHSQQFLTYSHEQWITLMRSLEYPTTIKKGTDVDYSVSVNGGDDTKISPFAAPDTDESVTWGSGENFSLLYKNILFTAESVQFGNPEDDFEIRGELSSEQELEVDGVRGLTSGYISMDREGKLHRWSGPTTSSGAVRR